MSHFLANILDPPHNVYTEYVAAQTLQRYFRGYITRKHMKFLHKKATIIQSNWRGVLGRKQANRVIKNKLDAMYQKFYDKSAIMIQKAFRGFYVRKYVFSFYKMKEKLNNVCIRNEELLEILQQYKETSLKEREQIENANCEKQVQLILFKLHHLIRTNQIEGIYSLKGTKEYSCIEKMMKKAKFKEYMEKKKLVNQAKCKEAEPHKYTFKGTWKKCEEAWLHHYNCSNHSLFNLDFYEETKEIEKAEKLNNYIQPIQDKPMTFKKDHHVEDLKNTLDRKYYKCSHGTKIIKKN
uniref:Spermatogenesis-associated protein 17 n=1 Tax=Clastoptera arizonana TaxID=38151 RepID=A0A1B6CWS1_9HEMI